jgi:SAM-dependent methyltransferase
MFTLKIQGKAQGRIIASETLTGMQKNVTQHMYGGDRTRKMKLWEKQKEGKKKMKELGRGNVIDIGCGKMKHKNLILSNKNVKKYTGLDLDEGKFEYKSKADIYWDGIIIPLNDNSVDGAILFEVIEHCPDPSIVIKEAFRILKPGSSILFSTPFLYHFHGLPHDYSRPTPSLLKQLFLNAGFSSVNIERELKRRERRMS